MNKIGILLAAGVLLVSPAVASFFTEVRAPTSTNELNHEQIIEGIYGDNFEKSGLNFVGTGRAAGVSITRINDWGSRGTRLHLLWGEPSAGDQLWTDGIATTTAQAKYAGLNQNLFYKDATGTHHLLESNGSGFLNGAPSSTFTVAGDFEWIRSTDRAGDTPTGDRIWSSRQDRNYGDPDGVGLDHMVTYKVEGLGTGETVWLLFWEDLAGPRGYLDGGMRTDRDFNDFVVEVRAVPLPGAALLGVIGFGVLSGLRRKLS